jgi:response regulator NasT
MRILIADDEPITALALAERVRSLGHEPLGPVHDGAEAVAAARAERPDLYLFDIEMPNVDGLTAAAELAAAGLRRPVVVVTGLDDDGLVQRSADIGVGAYVTKPVETRELHAAITLAAAHRARFEALETEVERSHRELRERKLVEQAKGLLMSALPLTEEEAFRRLRRSARDRNLRLAEVAERIVEQRELFAQASSRARRSGITSSGSG